MPDTLTHKLLAAHLHAGTLSPGDDITVAVDHVLIEDATGTMCAMQFEMLGAYAVAVPLAVMYVDHNVLQIDDRNMQDHRYLLSFAQSTYNSALMLALVLLIMVVVLLIFALAGLLEKRLLRWST